MLRSKILSAAALMLFALATTAKPGAAQCPQNEPRFSIVSGTGGAILTSVDQATIPVGGCITLRLIIVPQPGTPFDATLSANTTFTTNPTQGRFTSKNVFCALTSDCNKQFPIYAIWRDPCTNTTLVATAHITVSPCPPLGPAFSILCPPTGNITVNNESGVCGAHVSFATPTITGGTPPVTITCVPASGSLFPIGPTTVTCTATDATGAMVSCHFTVTVVQLPVTITCPPNTTICLPQGTCTATGVVTTPTINPPCPSTVVTCVPNTTTFPFGTTTITCTATDVLGTVVTCTRTVTVLPAGQSEVKEFVAAINGVATTGNPDQATVSVGDVITLGLIVTVPSCPSFNGVPFSTFKTDASIVLGTFSANAFTVGPLARNHQFPIYGIFFNPCTGTSQTATVHITVRP